MLWIISVKNKFSCILYTILSLHGRNLNIQETWFKFELAGTLRTLPGTFDQFNLARWCYSLCYNKIKCIPHSCRWKSRDNYHLNSTSVQHFRAWSTRLLLVQIASVCVTCTYQHINGYSSFTADSSQFYSLEFRHPPLECSNWG